MNNVGWLTFVAVAALVLKLGNSQASFDQDARQMAAQSQLEHDSRKVASQAIDVGEIQGLAKELHSTRPRTSKILPPR
jgi:hypothetical protein